VLLVDGPQLRGACEYRQFVIEDCIKIEDATAYAAANARPCALDEIGPTRKAVHAQPRRCVPELQHELRVPRVGVVKVRHHGRRRDARRYCLRVRCNEINVGENRTEARKARCGKMYFDRHPSRKRDGTDIDMDLEAPQAGPKAFSLVIVEGHGRHCSCHFVRLDPTPVCWTTRSQAFRESSRIEPQQVPVVKERRGPGPGDRYGGQQHAMPARTFAAHPCPRGERDQYHSCERGKR